MRRWLEAFEAAVFLATVYTAVMWLRTGEWQWEPRMILVGLPLVLVDLVRRTAKKDEGRGEEDSYGKVRWSAAHEPLSTAIQKALVFAEKQGLRDLERWLSFESRGWTKGMRPNETVPEYRSIAGRWQNPYGQCLDLSNSPEMGFVNEQRLRQSVQELESLARGNDALAIQDDSLSKDFRDILGVHVDRFVFHKVEIEGVLSRIRQELVTKLKEAENAAKH